MNISLRDFLRNFQRAKRRALSGEIVRIVSKDDVFVFQRIANAGKLLGCCKDTRPDYSVDLTLPVDDPKAWETD